MKWAVRNMVPRLLAVVAVLNASGCTRESVRVALAGQRRADQVQQAVFDRQHEALCLLLYRDAVRRLEAAGGELTAEQRAALVDAWNERDLLEFWTIQHERAKALRLVAVDAKLFADQSVVDLLGRSLAAKLERVEQGLAAGAGAATAKEVEK